MAAISISAFPRLGSTLFSSASQWTAHTGRTAARFIPLLAVALPGISWKLPTLDDIWESVLRAVPKNKVSHSRKRHRQMAGKALKDVTSLNKCPGCGGEKRSHRLCPHCLEDFKDVWRQEKRAGGESA
ncbi:Putative WD domain-containing protein [[Torrubiella] hemipterigena]|uniref:Large ribosomal subunit protein bL32m n=1 Tax=[Torrubiella] hemipterigena TaxID=1531966 RepID=A0A0A1SPL2_9HYPO|nr:Putative WD domain-containing protein [[Torrubiella] hemipterigena]